MTDQGRELRESRYQNALLTDQVVGLQRLIEDRNRTIRELQREATGRESSLQRHYGKVRLLEAENTRWKQRVEQLEAEVLALT